MEVDVYSIESPNDSSNWLGAKISTQEIYCLEFRILPASFFVGGGISVDALLAQDGCNRNPDYLESPAESMVIQMS